MIFINVGTHEQGMDRLFIELDRLIENGSIKEEVFAQIGYSSYLPKHYKYKDMIGYDEMDEWVRNANIVITHGGPGSIFHPLQYGKIPIVVPRNPEFNEHVDDHQILFTKRLESDKKILAIYDIERLNDVLENYDVYTDKCILSNNNLKTFIEKFDTEISLKLNL